MYLHVIFPIRFVPLIWPMRSHHLYFDQTKSLCPYFLANNDSILHISILKFMNFQKLYSKDQMNLLFM